MFNLYKTRLKLLLRQKSSLFWTLIFPIILATCFFFTIKPAYEGDGIDTINVGLVNETTVENPMGQMQYEGIDTLLSEAKIKDTRQLFNVSKYSSDDALKALNAGDINIYVTITDDGASLNAAGNGGIEESITKSVVETYLKVSKTAENLYKSGADMSKIDIESLYSSEDYVVDSNEMHNSADTLLNHYYSLLAMVCLFGGYFGVREITDIQANLSTKGCRINIAPTKKSKLLVSSLLAAYTVQVVEMALLLLYMIFVLKVNFGGMLPYAVAICLMGTLCGLFFGAMIASLFKSNEDTKTGLVTAISLFGCFLAGLMFVSMKYVVEKFFPIISYINPAALITDGMYSLYYYATLDRFYINFGILAAFTLVFALITIIKLRRLQYASL